MAKGQPESSQSFWDESSERLVDPETLSKVCGYRIPDSVLIEGGDQPFSPKAQLDAAIYHLRKVYRHARNT